MPTVFEVSYRNIEPSEAIEKRIARGVGKLERVCGRMLACRVMVELPNPRRRTGNLYRVRIELTIPGQALLVKRSPPRHRSHEDLAQALGEAFDDARRKLVELCRRQRGELKVHEPAPEGRVTRLFTDEGYGFIEAPDGREIYFHRNSVLNGAFDRIRVGTRVRFAEELGEHGAQASMILAVGRQGRDRTKSRAH